MAVIALETKSNLSLIYMEQVVAPNKWVKGRQTFQDSWFSRISSVQLLSPVWLFATPWTAVHQASLSITNSWNLPSPLSWWCHPAISSCHSLLLLPPIPPSIRLFSNESALHMRWPKYWSFNFNISASNEHSGLISYGWTGWISSQSKGLSRVFSNTTVQKHQFSGTRLSL